MSLADYYSTLEVSPDATLDQIKKAYRRLVRLYHPDLNKKTQDDRIKKINEAYAILGDAARRAAYDALLLQERRNAILREMLRRQEAAQREPRMTWAEGVVGFMREFKKALHDE